jgi:hypothetical protein
MSMRALSLFKAAVVTALIFVFYYFVQFRRWHRKVSHVLAEVIYEGDEVTVRSSLPGIPGKWAIEMYYYYKPNTTGHFIKYEVNADPNLFTNRLVLTYWLTELLHRTCKNRKIDGVLTLFEYRIYQMTTSTVNNVPVTLEEFFKER